MGYYRKILDILPTAAASRAFGAVSNVQLPSVLQRLVNRGFVSLARINRSEAALDIDDYPSLEALFTRELKPGSRTIAQADVVSPVDGKLSFSGRIHRGMLLQAKGHDYQVDKLIGTTACDDWIQDAYAFTIYLSPSNYHRIHSPMKGCITHMSYAPGRLLPVNRLGYGISDDLLPANERLTSFISSASGRRAALVKVGATCVGRISVVYSECVTNRGIRRHPLFCEVLPHYEVDAGSPLGCFELGSTVVLLVESDGFEPNADLDVGDAVQMGMALGSWRQDEQAESQA